jgi:flavin-dependent dehydrogenase
MAGVKMCADFDVVIAGAGPAGAWALKHLLGGTRALLVDAANPLESSRGGKLCGGMLTTQAQALLPEIPLEIRAEPFKTKLEYHDLDTGARARYPVDYANCYRGLLDEWLLRQALDERGSDVEYAPRTRVTGLQSEDEAVRVRLDNEREVTCSRFLDCTGWRQVSRRALGVPTAPYYHALQVECELNKPYPYYIAVFASEWTPFFGWFIPKSETAGEIGAAFENDRRDPLEEMLAPLMKHLREWGLSFERGRICGCRLTCPRKASDTWLGQERVLACGEAAGMVSPSSGDGISYALASGKAAAQAVGMPVEAALADYRRALSPCLAELRRNTVKSRLLANRRARRIAGALLPFVHRSHFERLSL